MLLLITRTVRSVTATGLSGVATVMRTTADILGGVSSVLRPDLPPSRSVVEPDETTTRRTDRIGERTRRPAADGAPPTAARDASKAAPDAEVTAEEIADTFEQRGRVKEATRVDVPDVTHAATSPTHMAEVANGTVSEVVAAVDTMSTDELRLLLEHETTHKRRRGILDAVEQALTP